MSGKSMSAVTDANFKSEVIDSTIPVLVDFWAEWCGPCKSLTPRIEALGVNYSGKVKIVSMDIDANPNTPSNFGIRSIPTLLMFKNGELSGELVGAHPNATIEDMIKKTLT